MNPHKQLTIGVFDSGCGGLSVLRALLPLIPNARYIYLGDTARLPYGSKSHETIARYAVSSAKFLHEQGAELLIIACNTATALALEDIQQALPIPVIGVVQPGAQAALATGKTIESPQNRVPHLRDGLSGGTHGRVPHLRDGLIVAKVGEAPQLSGANEVLVLATVATVQSHAYTRALNALGLKATEKACPLLVPLVEEGWINHPVTDEVLKIYLAEALTAAPGTHTLLLGCTHYPLLEPAVHRTLAALHHPLTIIDSARATAHAVAAHLGLDPQSSTRPAQNSECIFYATDSIEKFQHLGSSFLGQPINEVHLIDLGG
ncbi:MAG: aspartate/glutamate racemase family protein [Edaphobacter sp.]